MAIENPTTHLSYWDGPALLLLRRDGPGRALGQIAKAEKHILMTIVSASRFVTGDTEIEKRFTLNPFHGLYVISLINFARDLDGGGMWTPETVRGGQPFTLRFTAPELFRRTQRSGRKPRR